MAKSKGGIRGAAGTVRAGGVAEGGVEYRAGTGVTTSYLRRNPEMRPFAAVQLRKNAEGRLVIGDGRLHAAGVFPGQGNFWDRVGNRRAGVSGSRFGRNTKSPFEVMIQMNVKYSTGKMNMRKTVPATYLPYDTVEAAVKAAEGWLDGIDPRR
jgi:hypothetical protein